MTKEIDREEIFRRSVDEHLVPIRELLNDDTVSEVMINGHDRIFVERRGMVSPAGISFPSDTALAAAVRNIAQYVGRTIDSARPILDARLPDGSRICVIAPPAAHRGVHVSIRRFPRKALTMRQLVEMGSLTDSCRQFLAACVEGKQNILVAGGTGSGKTSMLNALSAYIPDNERIVVIEDSSEVQLQQLHLVQLEARPPDAKGRGAITIRDLLKATLRMRPDRIVVGEVRGGEAIDMIQAMITGHAGSMTTLHATHPNEAMHRLITLARMSDVQIPTDALKAQTASAINVIVQTSRLPDGSRRVTHVAECVPIDQEGAYKVPVLYQLEIRGRDVQGRLRSEMLPTGERATFAKQLVNLGLQLPMEMLPAM